MGERRITIVGGVSQSGKSVFARRYLLNAPLAYRFIFDPDSGPQSYAERFDCDAAGTIFELGVQLMEGWVIFNPHILFPGELEKACEWFCNWTHDKAQKLPGRKCLVIDEAWKYITPNRYPKPMAKCVQSGAAYGLECMFNTQNPYLLPGPILNEVTEIVSFKLGGVSDKTNLNLLARHGFNPEEIKSLEPLHFVARNLESGGELRGRIEL